jgi:hypothetical protein
MGKIKKLAESDSRVSFNHEYRGDVPPKRRTLSELHGVATHSTVLFICTTVRSSTVRNALS